MLHCFKTFGRPIPKALRFDKCPSSKFRGMVNWAEELVRSERDFLPA
jgi:hypothetical protein